MTKHTINELINLLQTHGYGHALISDDFGHWAVVSDGIQEIPEDPPADIDVTFFVTKKEWHPTIEAALEAFAAKLDAQ